MPGISTIRAKQRRAGSLGQSAMLCSTKCRKNVPSAQGYGLKNPSTGSFVSLTNVVQRQATTKICSPLNNENVLYSFYYQIPGNTNDSLVYTNVHEDDAKILPQYKNSNSHALDPLVSKYNFVIGLIVEQNDILLISKDKTYVYELKFYKENNDLVGSIKLDNTKESENPAGLFINQKTFNDIDFVPGDKSFNYIRYEKIG